jgi:hypothetical protein
MRDPLPPAKRMPAPDYGLVFQDRGDYLRVVITGARDSFDISLAYWNEIAAECERRGARALLVSDELPGEPIPPQDQERVIEALRESYMQHARGLLRSRCGLYSPGRVRRTRGA